MRSPEEISRHKEIKNSAADVEYMEGQRCASNKATDLPTRLYFVSEAQDPGDP